MPRPALPATGIPNTSAVLRDNKGNIIQRRFYDGRGQAVKDIDFDHDHGLEDHMLTIGTGQQGSGNVSPAGR